ncbi:hypothetical protein HYPBUDRAFT_152780 [Hyphopichia burtonii NRRL Y-1933]|uniref:Zinc finger PHD-type domain-containing protein n=1 Tax=Hyphopichia burtonii NRRL Y-1933 TaxID=984485 RepID=A0A1E4RLL6_9ASCO|nr:hypothetical protein HYPBUDRAFT_152780 [Hyphopichia burtonii NRRL Y-1933]ODV68164.1 hypothetical protein HYPBUDRAFT_152780 [Hyphopichia burtonii NRRL Y-1933]
MSRRSVRSSRSYFDKEEDDVNNYEAEPEDELEDDEGEEQEVTRCICGQDELSSDTINESLSTLLLNEYDIKIDQGLFIQCDKCSVWQHGYCVGLFINEDVPDKYWCELCKPDLHVFVYEHNESVRTLYKPVNDKRKKLQLENVENNENNSASSTRLRTSKRLTPSSSSGLNNDKKENQDHSNGSSNQNKNQKGHRKERRHFDDNYDEQLQKALRESAKESGINFSEDQSKKEEVSDDGKKEFVAPGLKTRPKRKSSKDISDNDSSPSKKVKTEAEKSGSDMNDVDESNLEEDNESSSYTKLKARSKLRVKSTKSKSTRKATPKSESKNTNSSGNNSNNPPLSKEELINQSSKPRYVHDKSTIYELRKRTGAILEWLGRSQLELEEEKDSKIQLFNYKEKPDNETDQRKLMEENLKIVNSFNENLSLMEKLTESILLWEQKFGKYAP